MNIKPALILLADIRPSNDNPRRDMGDVLGLAASIRTHGLLQPLVVAPEGPQYRLLAGHRRLAALRQIGQPTAPCIVVTDSESSPLALIYAENCQRKDLNPIEEAHALRDLAALLNVKPTDLVRHVHKNVDHIGRRMGLRELSESEQQQLIAKKITLGDAERRVKALRAESGVKMPGRRTTGWTQADRARVLYFTADHPLSVQANRLCLASDHQPSSKVHGVRSGVACGTCWEDVIRSDERQQTTGPLSG